MPAGENELRTTPSVLDRLIDLEPRVSIDPPKSRSLQLQDLKHSVRRDLEWLLNTRCHSDNMDGLLEEAPRSVAFYGLPDFTGIGAQSPTEQRRLMKMVETAIKNFEPRFLDPKVSIEPVSSTDRQLRFRISAKLDVEPAPEPVVFDTVLQFGSGDFVVTEK